MLETFDKTLHVPRYKYFKLPLNFLKKFVVWTANLVIMAEVKSKSIKPEIYSLYETYLEYTVHSSNKFMEY